MLLTYSILAMWVLLAASFVLASVAWLAQSRDDVHGLNVASGVCLGLAFGCVAIWSWILRDGLGPDSFPSGGVLAMQRFLAVAWLPFLVAGSGALLLGASWRARLRILSRRLSQR